MKQATPSALKYVDIFLVMTQLKGTKFAAYNSTCHCAMPGILPVKTGLPNFEKEQLSQRRDRKHSRNSGSGKIRKQSGNHLKKVTAFQFRSLLLSSLSNNRAQTKVEARG